MAGRKIKTGNSEGQLQFTNETIAPRYLTKNQTKYHCQLNINPYCLDDYTNL
jgi:hypothetical protein